MLPVQTVMIRYMVLVYRWGSGWLGAVGARGGFVGGAVTGGCARGGTLYRGRAKAPPTRGWRGLCAFREITYLSSKWFPFPVREQKLLVLRN